MLGTQGYGTGGSIVAQGYCMGPTGVVPPPPPPRRALVPSIMGGGGWYYPDMTRLPDIEIVDLTARARLEDVEEIDLRPLMLQELLRDGKSLEETLRQRLRDLDERHRELADLRDDIRRERERLIEDSAIAMRELRDSRSMFHGGITIPLTQTLPTFPLTPGRTVPPFLTTGWMAFINDRLVPFATGFLWGSGLTIVALMAWNVYKEEQT